MSRWFVIFGLALGCWWWLRDESPLPVPGEAAASQNEVAAEKVSSLLSELRISMQPGQKLTKEGAQSLIENRRVLEEKIAHQLGEIPPGALPQLVELYRQSPSREKLALIDGLGRNPSEEAVTVLESLYQEEATFRLREEILRSLGESSAPGRNDLLIEEMRGASDERLSQIAAQSLFGEQEALAALTQALYQPLPVNTRLEALHSIGAIGTEEARAALEEASRSELLEPRLRQFAGKEIIRSFGS